MASHNGWDTAVLQDAKTSQPQKRWNRESCRAITVHTYVAVSLLAVVFAILCDVGRIKELSEG